MITRILNYRFIQLSLSGLIIFGTLICVFTPNYFLFKMGATFAVQIMLGYLFLGLSFLIFQQPKLMFTSFACAAGLCMYLKYSTNSNIAHAERTSETIVSVAHFDMSASNGDQEQIISEILEVNADLISLQEVTPDWAPILEKELSKAYPYSKTVVRFDPFGLAIYSRMPINYVDTFECHGLPNLYGTVEMGRNKEQFCFITSHTRPSFYSSDFDRMREHLMTIAEYSNKMGDPVITIGDYNAVPWSYEILDFRTVAKLTDSRQGVVPASNGTFSLFQIPYDHIFYSPQFECIGFEDINSAVSGHIGVRGVYQLIGNSTL